MVILEALPLIDMYQYENELYNKGVNYIAGIDEAGRGPLVGPVVAACVVLPKDFKLDGLTDSKKLSPKKRELFYDIIMEQALGVGIGVVDAKTIDQVNIYQATKLAMKMAVDNTNHQIDHILIDAMKLDITIPNTPIIKGDSKSVSIAAASIIAKVSRDRMMDELDLIHHGYDFKHNKGYPTKKHLAALKKYGVLKEHRQTYGPVASILNNKKG
jgi:ribonuclease HII